MQIPLTFAQADEILAKASQAPFLKELKEEMENELHLVVLSAALGKATERDSSCGNSALEEVLSQCRPIIPDCSEKFVIVFEDYIVYQVRNESYTSYDDSEEKRGVYLLEFNKSGFLDYLSSATDACRLQDDSFYPGPWKHYGVYTQNHIVDVITQEEPKVLYLQNEK